MEDIKEMIMKIPPVSRYYIGLVFLLSFATTYRLLSPYSLVLDLEKVFYSFQVSATWIYDLYSLAMETDNYLCLCRAIQYGLHFHTHASVLHIQGM